VSSKTGLLAWFANATFFGIPLKDYAGGIRNYGLRLLRVSGAAGNRWDEAARDQGKADTEVDGYSSLSRRYEEILLHVVRDAMIGTVKRGLVVDFGCGTGRYLEGFHRKGFTCVGVDTSDGSLARARAKCPGADLVSVDLSRESEFVRRYEGRADLVYSVSVIQYLPPWHVQRILRNLVRLLDPGGYLHLLFPTPANAVDVWKDYGYVRYRVSRIAHLLDRLGAKVLVAEDMKDIVKTGRVLAVKG
jgi:SAM-dependent methyltransferase